MFKGNCLRWVSFSIVIGAYILEFFKRIDDLLLIRNRHHNGLAVSFLIDQIMSMEADHFFSSLSFIPNKDYAH